HRTLRLVAQLAPVPAEPRPPAATGAPAGPVWPSGSRIRGWYGGSGGPRHRSVGAAGGGVAPGPGRPPRCAARAPTRPGHPRRPPARPAGICRRRARVNCSGQQASGGVTRAGRREWAGLAVLALACLLYAMDLTVLHLAVPAISEDLRPSGTQLLWITDIYG